MSGNAEEHRTMVVWCPDWPIIAAEIAEGIPASDPVAVLHANRVIACSGAARAEGVRQGLRKRDAQSRCPQLVAIDYDPARDARTFEPVVAAVEQIAASVAVLRPGVCALAARGPSRYFGGEEAAAERIVEQVAAEYAVEAQIGIAAGVFAGLLAARQGHLIAPGRTAEYLAELPVSTLDRPALADLLRRLGVRTLGAFAALNPSDVLARFGLDAALAQRLAAGQDERPLAVREPPPDLEVQQRPDEPIDRVDVAAFAARALAEQLQDKLTGYGLVCTRLAITAITGDGQELHRVWRHEGVLTASAIADRTRWQLDGWLARHRAAGGIIALRLAPQGVLAQVGLQPGLWGEAGTERDRAHRAMHRVQGMLGPEAVVTPVPGGGRDPAARVTTVPWGDERLPARPDGPWPGQLPAPRPARAAAVPVTVLDAAGRPVTVSARLALSAPPDRVVRDGAAEAVVDWAGPWPVDEAWWDARRGRRVARLQVLLADGQAFLLESRAGQWQLRYEFD